MDAVRRLPSWAVALLLVAGYQVVQIVLLEAPVRRDPETYLRLATEVFEDTAKGHHGGRIGLLIPTWVSWKVFGFSEATYYFVPLLSGAVLVASTFTLGRVLFGRGVGVAAGVLVFFNPFILTDSSHLFPDLPATAWFTAGMAILVFVADRAKRGEEWDRRAHLWLAAAGLAFAMAYLSKESIALFSPLAPFAWWRLRVPWRPFLFTAGSALVVFIGEMVFQAVLMGDPFRRIDIILGRGEGGAGTASRAISAAEFQDTPAKSFSAFPRLLWGEARSSVVYLGFGVIAVVAAVWSRKTRFVIVASWIVWMWLLFGLLGLVVQESGGRIIRLEKLRYWIPMFPPLVIGGVAALTEATRGVLERWQTPWSARAAMAVPMVVLVMAAGVGLRAVVNGGDYYITTPAESAYRELRTWLADNGDGYETIWADGNTTRHLRMYVVGTFGSAVWDGNIEQIRTDSAKPWTTTKVEAIGPADLVLFDPSGWGGTNKPEAVPEFVLARPDDWSLVFAAGEFLVYSTQPGGHVETILEVGGAETPWRLQPDGDPILRDPGAVGTSTPFVVAKGDVLGIQSGDWESAPLVPAGWYVTARIELGLEGASWVVVRCGFEDPDGYQQLVRARVRLDRRPLDPGPVDFVCRVPDDAEEYRLVVSVVAHGEVSLQIGAGRISIAEPPG